MSTRARRADRSAAAGEPLDGLGVALRYPASRRCPCGSARVGPSGPGAIPALGFGTLIPDPMATRTATKAALKAGFRQLDASERYRNEKEVGEAMQEVFKAGMIKREEVFIATKVWNNNHRPDRVKPAFEASLKKLQLDYVDLYLIHTPFAFQPGDEQD